MSHAYAEIAFTPRVREEQRRFGSAEAYSRVLSQDREGGTELTAREAAFLSARDGIFLATVSETGWPYVQFRGGAPGFLKVIDQQKIAFADYRGNRQYISVGNLRHDDRVSIIAVDFARRERLKLLGHARITEDPDIIDLLNGSDGPQAERGIVIRIVAVDWNCPQHIPVRLTDAERDHEVRALGVVEHRRLRVEDEARVDWSRGHSRHNIRHAERDQCICPCHGPGGRDDADGGRRACLRRRRRAPPRAAHGRSLGGHRLLRSAGLDPPRA